MRRGIREPEDPEACTGKPWCEEGAPCTCQRRARWPYDRRQEADLTKFLIDIRRGPEDRRSMRGLDTDSARALTTPIGWGPTRPTPLEVILIVGGAVALMVAVFA